MANRKKRKRFRLKTGFKRFLVYLLLFICVGIYASNEMKKIKADWAYKKTYEYKLSVIGYNETEIDTLLQKLPEERINSILDQPYNMDYYLVISQKYYMEKNLDKYLEYALYHKEDDLDIEVDDSLSEEEKNKYLLNEKYKRFVAYINVHANEGWYNVTYETNVKDDYLVLVNKFYYLPDGYVRDDIQNISLEYAYADMKASQVVIDNFEDMRNQALQELNVHLMVNSSYRPFSEQKELYDQRKNLWGQRKADQYAARPGHSEHQTGLSIDITSLEHPYDEQFMDSDEYKWLINNSYKYGFILRYPKGKEDITGYSNESWHFRYVGKDAAKQIYDEGITFDEYYAYYIEK